MAQQEVKSLADSKMHGFAAQSVVSPSKKYGQRFFNVSANLPQPQQQTGVALLTVLLLVVAITVLAGTMISSQRLHQRQYQLLINQDTILQNVHAGENIATAIIAADNRINDTDSRQDAWAQPIPPLEFNGQNIQLTMNDASSRFNLNNLYHDGAVDEVAMGLFKQLLTSLDISPNLAYAVLDWQDPDGISALDDITELAAYASLSQFSTNNSTSGTNIHIPNQPLLSIDELDSIQGFTPQVIAKLRPFITTIPYYLPLNINTADPLLLQALLSQSGDDSNNDNDSETQSVVALDSINIDSFIQQRESQPIESIDALFEQVPESQLSAEKQAKIKRMMAVESGAFTVLIDIILASDINEDQNPDSNNANHKHRYATTIISKQNPIAEHVGETDNSSNHTGVVSTESEDESIRAFGTRLWTYRPAI